MLSRDDLATFFLRNTWLRLLIAIRYSRAPSYRTVIYQLPSSSHTCAKATAGSERKLQAVPTEAFGLGLRAALGNLKVYGYPTEKSKTPSATSRLLSTA